MADRRCTWTAWETGHRCRAYRCHDLPVCASHIRRWALANPRELAKARMGRIRNAAARTVTVSAAKGSFRHVDVFVYQRPGEEVRKATQWRRSSARVHGPVVCVRMRKDTAQVIADELADLGDRLSCEMIMRAVGRLRQRSGPSA